MSSTPPLTQILRTTPMKSEEDSFDAFTSLHTQCGAYCFSIEIHEGPLGSTLKAKCDCGGAKDITDYESF